MILVAEQTVLTRHAAGVTGLAEVLFHLTEIRHEILRVPLLVALQIGAAFFKVMAGQTTARLHDAEMRLMDEIREASLLALGRWRGEIYCPPSTLDVRDAVTFRARPPSASLLVRKSQSAAAR